MAYCGGKGGAGVYQQIINKMPRHSVYIETHLGGGSIMKHKRTAAANIGIDIYAVPLIAFRSIIGKHDDGRRSSLLKMAPGTEPSHTTVSDAPAPLVINVDDCSRTFSSFSSMMASNDVGSDAISLIHGNAHNFLEQFDFKGDELVYCDPPYMFDTRKSKRQLYEHEYTDDDHINLLNIIKELPCFVMISGYKSSLYKTMLQHWYYFEFTAQTRQGPAVESLWCNFDPDKYAKHDTQFTGDNFRERERIKRKCERWMSKLREMHQDERDVIVCSILDEYGDAAASLKMAIRDLQQL